MSASLSVLTMLAGIAVGYLGQRAWDAWQDRRLMRRLHFQPWYPQMSGKLPTVTTTSATFLSDTQTRDPHVG